MTNGIILKNVSFGYDQGEFQLHNISITIPKGNFYGITGVNGSGKTTLTMLLNGLIPQEKQGILKGDVTIDGCNTKWKSVSFFAKKIGMLFQNPDFMLFNLTVVEEIAFGLRNFQVNNLSERIGKALETVGLSGFEKRDPQSLSFGEKQKLALACILALDTDYIVLDEPAAMLDYKSAVNLYQTLKKLNEMGKTIIVVEHDTDFLLTFVNRVLIINKGRKVFEGTPKSVFAKERKLKEIGIKIPDLIR